VNFIASPDARYRPAVARLSLAASVLLALAACAKHSFGDACQRGDQGCACSPVPPTCAEGLVCDIGTCLPPGGVTGTGTGADATDTFGEESSEGSGSGGGSLDCTGACAPPDVGCEPGEGCYPQPDGFLCAPSGDLVPGEACEFVNDCVPGSACFQGGDGLACTSLCTDDAACPQGLACAELESAVGCICS
jgi:hypothetical protein